MDIKFSYNAFLFILIISSFLLLIIIPSIIAPTSTYDSSDTTTFKGYENSLTSCNQPQGPVNSSRIPPCGTSEEISTADYTNIQASDGNRLSTNVLSLKQDFLVFPITIPEKNNNNRIDGINWSWIGEPSSSNLNVSLWLYNYSGSIWQPCGGSVKTVVSGSAQHSLNCSTGNIIDFVSSVGDITFMLWGNNSDTSISLNIQTDYIKVAIDYTPYFTINTNGTLPTIPFWGNTTQIWTNLTTNVNTLTQVNFSVTTPNNTRVINNQNASFSYQQFWNSSTFVIGARGLKDLGTWNWNYTAVDNKMVNITRKGNFTISNTAPTDPSYNSPANQTNFTSAPSLKWNNGSDLEITPIYNLQVDDSCAFGSVNYENKSIVETASPTEDTATGLTDGNYCWRVRINDTISLNNFITGRSFRLDTTSPSISSVQINETTIYINNNVKASAVSTDATTYVQTVLLAENSTSSWVNQSTTLAGSTYSYVILATQLSATEKVSYYFISNDSLGNTAVSSENSFTVQNRVPSIVKNVTAPANPIWGNLVYIIVNISDIDGVSDIKSVNFSLSTPNNTKLLDKVNGTLNETHADVWNSTTAFNISSYGLIFGKWDWSVIVTDVENEVITGKGNFSITNNPPILKPVVGFEKNEDFGIFHINFTNNESDVEEVDFTKLIWNISSNNSDILSVSIINLPDNNFSFSSLANQTGSINITLRLNDSSGDSNYSSFIITINNINDPPTNTTLLTPNNNSLNGNNILLFSWINSTKEDPDRFQPNFKLNYLVEIYNSSELSAMNRTNTTNLITNTQINIHNLINGTYFWRGRVNDTNNSNNLGPYSDVFTFQINTTFPSISKELTHPSSDIIFLNTSVYINATIVGNSLQVVWLQSDFNGSWMNTTALTSTIDNYTFFIDKSNFTNQKVIQWQYFANTTTNLVTKGDMKSFRVNNRVPIVTLNFPPNNSVQTISTVTLSTICTDDDNEQTTAIFYGASAQIPTTILNNSGFYTNGSTINFDWTGLSDGVTYYWRSKCQDTNSPSATPSNSSDYSEERNFVINLPGSSGGGGGGAQQLTPQLIGFFCNISGQNWQILTESRTPTADFFVTSGDERTRTIIGINKGTKPVTLDLSCQSNGTNCDFVNLEQIKLILEPNPLKEEIVEFKFKTPLESIMGTPFFKTGDQYFFNIFATDSEKICSGNIGFRAINDIRGYLFKTIFNIEIIFLLPILIIIAILITGVVGYLFSRLLKLAIIGFVVGALLGLGFIALIFLLA